LSGRTSLVRRDRLDRFDEPQVAFEIFLGESGRGMSEVVVAEIVELLEFPGEEPSTERAVRDDADLEFSTGVEDPALALGIPTPQRPFCLDRADRMDRMRAPFSFMKRPMSSSLCPLP
jgi:hypothetical protein